MDGPTPDAPDDDLPLRLAAAGVAVYAEPPADGGAWTVERLAALVGDVVDSDRARMVVALPALLVARGALAAPAVELAGARLDGRGRRVLGLLHRIARALAVSRAPDLDGAAAPGVVSFEPADLPDPEVMHGRLLLAEACDADDGNGDLPGLAGGAVRMFDTWLAIREVGGVDLVGNRSLRGAGMVAEDAGDTDGRP